MQLFGSQVNIHPACGNNFIDANALDKTGGPEDVAMEKILALSEAQEITLLLPYSLKNEIAHPNTPPEVKRKAARMVYSVPVQLTGSEQSTHKKTIPSKVTINGFRFNWCLLGAKGGAPLIRHARQTLKSTSP